MDDSEPNNSKGEIREPANDWDVFDKMLDNIKLPERTSESNPVTHPGLKELDDMVDELGNQKIIFSLHPSHVPLLRPCYAGLSVHAVKDFQTEILDVVESTNPEHQDVQYGLSDEDVDAALTSKVIELVSEATGSCRKLFSLIVGTEEIEEAGTKPHRNLAKKLEEALSVIDDYLYNCIEELEFELLQANRARSDPIIFNWEEAAPSAEPTEKINISDAPPVPQTVREMLASRYRHYFLRAMLKEMEALRARQVFEETLLPEGRKAIKSKWVFDYKTDPVGFILRFKARLVAVGCAQVKNQDYTETHSPVVKHKSVRIMLALSMVLGLHIGQIDIATAYLYGTLSEINYMKMPSGFEKMDKNGKPLVAKLIKSLYGLHQSGREWYFTMKSHLIDIGFVQFKSDPCVFMKFDKVSGAPVIILLYVDDILIISSSSETVQAVKDLIKNRFEIKDLGEANWILKIHIRRFKHGIFLCQSTYTTSILKEHDLWETSEKSWKRTPMETNWKHDESSPELDGARVTEYVSLIAKLIYLSQITRPEITFAVNTLAQFQKTPREHNWIALVRICRYLRKTFDWGLYYQKDKGSSVIVFTRDDTEVNLTAPFMEFQEGTGPELSADASYAEEYDRKSRSAYAFMIFGCLVSWYSKKQTITSLSSTEAETYALVEGIKEAIWMKTFLSELGFNMGNPITAHQDNQSTIAIAVNPIHHARIKHMEVKTYYIRENINNGVVKLVYCPTEFMIADIFTKALPASRHLTLCGMMGIRSMAELEEVEQKPEKGLVATMF